MTMMWPLPAQDKGMDVVARLADLIGWWRWRPAMARPTFWSRACGATAAGLGHDLESGHFPLAGNGDPGPTLQLADGRVVKRLPEPHCLAVSSTSGSSLWSVVYGTREG